MAAELAEASTRSNEVDAVIAVGGDGTIREIAHGLSGSRLPLLVWPTGTENLFAKSFGYRGRPDVIPACVQAGRYATIDVGVANGHSFLVVAGMGFDAEVVERLVRLRNGHITHLTYTGPIWRTFWEHKFPAMRVYSKDKLLWEGRGLVFVGNMPRYSLGLRVIRDAIPDDGLLDVCIMPCRTQAKLLLHSARTVLRRHVERGGVRYFRLTNIRVESDERVPLELDGEAAGTLPVEFSIRPNALRLLVPPGRSSG
jgi:diacylglycerol kinase family enzyme